MPRSDTPTSAAIVDAFAALAADGRRVTVRALRERAGCSTEAARVWLKANRPGPATIPVPADALAPILEPLWAAALAAARDEIGERVDADRAVAVDAEAAALDQAATHAERADVAEAAVAERDALIGEVRAELEAAEQRAEQAAAAAQAAQAETLVERDRARQAERDAASAQVAAARAEATADTFRDIVEALKPGR